MKAMAMISHLTTVKSVESREEIRSASRISCACAVRPSFLTRRQTWVLCAAYTCSQFKKRTSATKRIVAPKEGQKCKGTTISLTA